MKINEMLLHETWLNLTKTILRKRSQIQKKYILYESIHIKFGEKAKLISGVKTMVTLTGRRHMVGFWDISRSYFLIWVGGHYTVSTLKIRLDIYSWFVYFTLCYSPILKCLKILMIQASESLVNNQPINKNNKGNKKLQKEQKAVKECQGLKRKKY